jgi:hypothetical protein
MGFLQGIRMASLYSSFRIFVIQLKPEFFAAIDSSDSIQAQKIERGEGLCGLRKILAIYFYIQMDAFWSQLSCMR